MTKLMLSLALVFCALSPPRAHAQQESVGQLKLPELAFLIGNWESVNVNGEKTRTTFRWINNKSYIENVFGEYREIIGWDLDTERFTSWAFGTDGGQGKLSWARSDNQWIANSDAAFVNRWNQPMTFSATYEPVDPDTINLYFQRGNGTPSKQTLKRVPNKDAESKIAAETVPERSATDHQLIGQAAMRAQQFQTAEEHFRHALRMLDQPSGDDVERLKVTFAFAQVLRSQEKYLDAVGKFDEVLSERSKLLGAKHADVAETKQAILQTCRTGAFRLCNRKESSDKQLRDALQLAEKAAELEADNPRIWLQAWAHHRLGDQAQARECLRESFARDYNWPILPVLAAMIEKEAGNQKLAQAHRWMAKELIAKNPVGQPAQLLQQLGQQMEQPPAEWSEPEHATEPFELILKQSPSNPMALATRGRHHGQCGDWKQALRDYHAAAEASPVTLRFREGEAAITIWAGSADERDVVLGKLVDEHLDAGPPSPRMDVVLMCSLVADAPVDRKRLNQVADQVLDEVESRNFLELTKAFALYRLGQYDDALSRIPTGGSTNPKDTLLAYVLRAMCHDQLGNKKLAKRMLAQADAAVQEQLPSPDGAPMQYQDRPIVWCMVHSALREAKQLIDS